jgi:hypothetical protein
MACGCARTRMSSSSTTTSDPRRSPNPRIHAWIRGFRASRGASIGPDSAGIPQEIRSRCRLIPIRESAQPRSGVTQSSPGLIWLTPSRTTQSSASVTSCASRYRSLSLQISLRAAPILAASPRAPRTCRVTRAAPPEALRTSMPLPQSGVVVRVRGITQIRAEVDLHTEQVVAVARRPGRTYGVWSVRSRRREGSF